MSQISIKGVKKVYQKTEVIHGVDVEIEAGEFVVILGPSGCGKSTLLRMIAGLEDISAGEISIGGRVVNQLEPRERGCAMVFQNYALYPHMTVRQNIGYALKVAKIPKPEREARVMAVAAVGIARCRSSIAGRASSRAASASASPWPAPWCASPRCSCSTSRSRTSTPSCASPCAPKCAACTAISASPRCSSRTTRPRR